jgi:putative glycosyltransferase (TIGR04348 family)
MSAKILLVTPAPPGSLRGNRITAVRWARILRGLDRRVVVREEYHGERCDLLVALHALRSYPSIERYRGERPDAPLVLALTGTDLYGFIHTHVEARRSLQMATRVIVLQPLGMAELPAAVQAKTRVIYQSVPLRRMRAERGCRHFDVCVLGHLRPVKDPFRTALAAQFLPASSRVRVRHLGAALSEAMAERARREEASNPRYRWLGELPRWRAMQVLGRCRLLALTSEMEGGANAISEAAALSVPVVASRIAGSVGLLGEDYPGYFAVGDTAVLARLLERAETDARFYRTLQRGCARLRRLIDPVHERQSWAKLLKELGC